MTEIIDFKNARYQGSTKNHQPHGLGILLTLFQELLSIIKIYFVLQNGNKD